MAYIVPPTRMNRTLVQRLIATVCLVAFGFGQTVFAFMGVRCTDGSGISRIEFACMKSGRGACLTPCIEPGVHADGDDHASDPVPPSPCEDVPLGARASAAGVLASSVTIEPVLAAAVVAILWDRWPLAGVETTRWFRPCRDRDRPPDARLCLRSIILVV